MKTAGRTALTMAAIGLVIWGVSACTAWKWKECRKVGHGVAYCVLAGSR